MSFLHLRADERVALLAAARTWLTPGGHLIYLGHADQGGTDGGCTHVEFPDIADLARACDGMRIDETVHIVRSHIDSSTVDVLMHARVPCAS